MDWEELKKYNKTIVTEEFKRDEKVKRDYEKYKKDIEREGKTLTDVVYEKYFKYNNNIWVLDKNLFPYELNKNIKHYVLWVRPGIEFTYDDVERILGLKDYVVFKNHPKTMSVPYIQHFHVFIKC